MGQNHAYTRWESSQYVNGCDAPGATAALAGVPSNIVIQNNWFRNHWTGTVALFTAANSVVSNNTFYDNYTENSWDGNGGTVLDGECNESTDWNSNAFVNSGLGASVITPAFEFYGQGRAGKLSYIRNNAIVGQPLEAFALSSTKYLEVSSNIIVDASRSNSTPDAAAIRIDNFPGWRGSDNVNVFNNTITQTGNPAISMDYGIAIGGCVNGGACSSLTNITLGTNSISGVAKSASCQRTFANPLNPTPPAILPSMSIAQCDY